MGSRMHHLRGNTPARHLVVTEAEGAALAELVKELEARSGAPFAFDPPVWMRTLPAHVLSPSRVRDMVKRHLGHLPRFELVAEKFLAELTIAGRPFLELEAGGGR